MDIKKSSGLILHPSSLPGEYGIGDLGLNSFNFVDLLKSSKTNIWQVLPLGITDEVEYSPYSSKSSILGNPYLISINDIENNMFDKDNLNNLKELSTYEVEFKKVYSYKQSLFQTVSKRIDLNDSIYSDFLNKNELIKKHLTFVTLSEVNGKNWVEWDKDYLNYSEDTFQKVMEKFKDTLAKNVFLQYEFNSQWKKLKKYANLNNVCILGDIPIYVNHNSADVWLNKDLFDLDENNQMGYVSGAVPDDFTVEGQIWNTALYDWDNHNETDYSYWIEKLNENLNNFDYLRIDHFIGFFKFWAIPFGKPALDGHWRDGPWETFFEKISNNVNFDKLLAEDLGVVLDTTAQILEKYGIPGMKVLQQRIPDKKNHDEIHPKNWSENVVAYTGTHDSPTIHQWFDETGNEQINFFKEYKKELNNKFESDVWNFISMTWESPCKVAITTTQDLLELGAESRFNLPGTQKGNWKWRIEDLDQLSEPLEKLKLLNQACERITT
tara:strand:- start:143 stop:1627 length:1485 start_codon:yes stop_codon:yes gene_type:complete